MKAQLTVRIPDELEQELSALAQRLRLKRSDIVRLALEKFVAEFRNGAEQRPYDKVKDLVGSIASDIPDLGEKHREHLLARFGKHAYRAPLHAFRQACVPRSFTRACSLHSCIGVSETISAVLVFLVLSQDVY